MQPYRGIHSCVTKILPTRSTGFLEILSCCGSVTFINWALFKGTNFRRTSKTVQRALSYLNAKKTCMMGNMSDYSTLSNVHESAQGNGKMMAFSCIWLQAWKQIYQYQWLCTIGRVIITCTSHQGKIPFERKRISLFQI